VSDYMWVAEFGNAWGEYSTLVPDIMQHPFILKTRPDVKGCHLIRFAEQGMPFGGTVRLFGSSVSEIIVRAEQWAALQAEVATLYLPEGYVPNMILLNVRKQTGIRYMVNATNGESYYQVLALTFQQQTDTES